MNRLTRISSFLTAGLLMCGPAFSQADPDAAASAPATVWDRFYGQYDATFRDWKDLPGIELFSHRNGDPDIVFKPRMNSVEHRGTLGVRLPESWAVLNGQRPRIEGGGSSEEGFYRSQYDTGPEFTAPIIVKLKNPSTTSIDISGLGLATRNSYTYLQSEHKYFIDYKLDYDLFPSVIMTPKIGYTYSQLYQVHRNFLVAPAFNTYLDLAERVNSDSHGIRTGLDLQTPIGGGFDLLFGVQYTVSYDEVDLRVDVFDFADGPYYVEDGRSVMARTTDLTLGVSKKLWGAVLTVSGGISFYSDMPRVVNPTKPSDMDTHLESQSAHSEYVRLTVSYAI